MTTEALARRLRDLADEMYTRPPCQRIVAGEMGCISAEANRPLTPEEQARGMVSRPYSDYDPGRMCLPCVAFWFASQAAQALHLHAVHEHYDAVQAGFGEEVAS